MVWSPAWGKKNHNQNQKQGEKHLTHLRKVTVPAPTEPQSLVGPAGQLRGWCVCDSIQQSGLQNILPCLRPHTVCPIGTNQWLFVSRRYIRNTNMLSKELLIFLWLWFVGYTFTLKRGVCTVATCTGSVMYNHRPFQQGKGWKTTDN